MISLGRKVTRASVRVEWGHAARIAGGEGRLEEHLRTHGKKAPSFTLYQKPLDEGGGIPIQEIGDLILQRLAGIVPKPEPVPEDLAIAQRNLIELYKRTRRDKTNWNSVTDILNLAIGVVPRAGERYRPIASPGGAPPG